MIMERLGGLVLATAFMVSAIYNPSESRADDPVAFLGAEFSAEEWQVIEGLLMQPKRQDTSIWQPINVHFVHFIMMDKDLPQPGALAWIRENAVAVAYSDLTGDGTNEFLVMFFHDYLQGNSAAPTVILEQTTEGWRPLSEIQAYDIGIYGDPPPPYPLCVSDERLNGRPYFYSLKEVRYWNGTEYNWDCVTRCEESLPENHSIGQKISQDLGCIRGR
jgi:hypothetical protein